jgi:hypothetical protein
MALSSLNLIPSIWGGVLTSHFLTHPSSKSVQAGPRLTVHPKIPFSSKTKVTIVSNRDDKLILPA